MLKRLLAIFVLFISCSENENIFYKDILSSKGMNSAHIVIDIDSDEYKGRIVTTNFRLFQYYHLKEKISRNDYQDLVYSKLLNDESFNINDKKFIEEFYYMKYKPVKDVDSIANLGKKEFIKYFFNRDVIKKEYIARDQYTKEAIIKQLFDWEIACHNDSETGYLIITEYERNPNWTILE